MEQSKNSHKNMISFFLPFLLFFSSCQIPFYLEGDGWGTSYYGATTLDRELIFRQERLRADYKTGNLTSAQGLYETETVKLVMEREGNRFFLTFFGTDDVTEVYYDMIHWLEPFWTDTNPGIAVHAGFNRPLQDAMGPVINGMSSFLTDNPAAESREIYILGHSAGGVHAVLCAFTLTDIFPQITDREIYVQTGGSPAPGNQAFADHFNSKVSCHRYINGSDMMPSLLTPAMGYVHVGQGYRIGPSPNSFYASTGLWLTHHFISDYADSLR